MNIIQLQRLSSAGIGGDDKRALPSPGVGGDDDKGGFRNTLKNAIDQVDGAQKEADGQISAFVSGEQENLHEVMISMNQAQISLQLMTEVRNKMLETYQELMRMQV